MLEFHWQQPDADNRQRCKVKEHSCQDQHIEPTVECRCPYRLKSHEGKLMLYGSGLYASSVSSVQQQETRVQEYPNRKEKNKNSYFQNIPHQELAHRPQAVALLSHIVCV
jgi:hypothetical protein